MDAYLNGVRTASAKKPGEGKVQAGSLDAVAISFYQCDLFKGLRASTQVQYRRVIEDLRRDHGGKPFALLDKQGTKKLLEEKSGRLTAYNRRLRMLKLMVKHAMDDLELLDEDPTEGVTRKKHQATGFRPWDEGHIEQYRARHPSGTTARLALELLLNVGQRRGDTVTIGRQHLREGGSKIGLRQSKTGEWVNVPILPDLQRELALLPATQMTFLEVNGRPRSANGFYNTFRDWCAQAGLEAGLAPHGLRKACGRRLAEAEGSAHMIMAVLGHRTLAEAQKYCDDVNRARLAEQGMEKVRVMTRQGEK
ncbi:tyrosine-type recombinase/integrase [Rhodovarius crocodyli]|nr:tyrosine-type recombinase/integrase [Rhodovarius crocodyli]